MRKRLLNLLVVTGLLCGMLTTNAFAVPNKVEKNVEEIVFLASQSQFTQYYGNMQTSIIPYSVGTFNSSRVSAASRLNQYSSNVKSVKIELLQRSAFSSDGYVVRAYGVISPNDGSKTLFSNVYIDKDKDTYIRVTVNSTDGSTATTGFSITIYTN